MAILNKSHKLLTLFLAIFMVMSFVVPTFGAVTEDNGKIVNYSDSGISADALVEAMGGDSADGYKKGNVTFKNGTLTVITKGTPYELLTVAEDKIYVNPTAFKQAKQSDVSAALNVFTAALTDVGSDPDTVHQIMKDMQDIDDSVSTIMLPLIFDSTKGDMYAAYKITSPFLNVLSVVLGVGAVGLILLLLFSTVMDLAYIGLPVWRETQSDKNGKHPFGVSYEALRTVNEVEKGIGGGDGEYRNAYLLYFKRRALTYIILAICIMYLICGGLSGIIGFVLQLVSGITG